MSEKAINAKEVGRRIAQARKESNGMTQRKLADAVGVTERSVAAWEGGETIPYRHIRALEGVLRRPAAWFLYGDQPSEHDDVRELLLAIKAQLDAIQARLS